MKIVFICQNFPPEIGAPSARVYEMSKCWVELGSEVHVVTGFPNHPTGIIPDEYKGMKYKLEMIDGIHVHRNYIYATPNKGLFKRTLGYISFMISSVIISMKKIKNPDIIISTSPQFFTIFSGYRYSKRKKVPFILEIRDLWPAAIIELEMIKEGFITRFLEKIELSYYRKCDKLIMVTESFKEDVISRGIDKNKIDVITNGVNEEIFYPRKKNETIINDYNLKEKFIVSYVGNHGHAQNLGTILKVAKSFLEHKDIQFLFVGEGAEKEKLKKIAQEQKINNIIFINGQHKENIPELYCTSDICLIPLKNIKLFTKTIPSKMFEIMACGTPIVGSVQGEAANILRKSESAMVVESDNSEEIKKAIIRLKDDKELYNRLKKNGPTFVSKYYLRRKLAKRYADIIEDVVSKEGKQANRKKPKAGKRES